MPDTIKVIIARYREDVSWATSLGYDCVVYDKGGESLPGAVPLENIGRESHTYLSHIVRHYDALAKVNVFVQGNPFDHLDRDGNGSPSMLQLKIADVADGRVPFRGFAWFRLECDVLGRPHDLRLEENKGRWTGWGRDIPVGEVFTKLFGVTPPARIVARAPAGLFAVTGERIRTRPKAFYEYALSLLEQDPDDAFNTGHAMERLWQYVFNGNTAWNREVYE
ncbi:DUF3431 domain-containing protein [Pseudodesulfovibrio sp.]|uniref:DUF3431 domain-containing protein n=1 Tax=unclassified Pseudodesulfovibrio TaxID=2661612 RepID=UPI003B00130E